MRYAEAAAGVTRCGSEGLKTSCIMGLATDMRAMPPVARSEAVEKRSQYWGVAITAEGGTALVVSGLAEVWPTTV